MELGFLEVLTLIFITLKLTGLIAWPWLYVLSPMLIGVSAAIIIFVICEICKEYF